MGKDRDHATPPGPPTAVSRLDRRHVSLLGLLSAVLPAAASLGAREATAARKKRPDRCSFAKSGDTWRLKRDCVTTKYIKVPAGITLDGNGKTIHAKGNWWRTYSDGVIRVTGGGATVKDLTINGKQMQCKRRHPSGTIFDGALVITRSATIARVTIENICTQVGVMISATGVGGVTILAGCTVRGAKTLGLTTEDQHVMIQGCTFSGSPNGIEALNGTMDIQNSTITGTGRGDYLNRAAGIRAVGGAIDVRTSVISNFYSVEAPQLGCGVRGDGGQIRLAPSTTFPEPPGNQHDLCGNVVPLP